MKDKKFVSMVLVPSFALLFLFVVFPLFYGLGISFLIIIRRVIVIHFLV